MKPALLIRPHSSEASDCDWMRLDHGGSSENGIQHSALRPKETQGKQAVIVVPGDEVMFEEAELGKIRTAQAHQAIPFMFEDSFAQDVQDLHFAYGPTQKGHYPVAVIARKAMHALIDLTRKCGLSVQSMIPEPLLLPYKAAGEGSPPEWSVVVDTEHAIVRYSRWRGFRVHRNMLDTMLADLVDKSELPPLINLYAVGQPPNLDIKAEIAVHPIDSALEFYATQLHSVSGSINLLQGVYGTEKPWKTTVNYWKWPLVGGGLMALFAIAYISLDYLSLARDQQRINDMQQQAFSQAFPEVGLVEDPARQMRSRLNQMRQGLQGGSPFLPLLQTVGSDIASSKGNSIQVLNYRENRFDIEIKGESLQTLDALAVKINKNLDLEAQLLSANESQGEVRGQIRIEAKK